MKVDFYHLTAAPLDRVLPQIAEKVLANGARMLIVTDDAAQRAALDRLLWTYAPDSFLPHAQAGGEGDADQPILIAATLDAANGARSVAIVDGRWRDEICDRDGALAFDRAFHLFDDEAIQEARLAWKALGAREGIERRYWKQNDAGRWEQAA